MFIVAVLTSTQSNHTRLSRIEWRQQQLQSVCSRLTFLSKPFISWGPLHYFNDKQQYFYCGISKVASTSWILALLKLAGVKKKLSKTMDIRNWRLTDTFFKRAALYTPRQRQMMLVKYYKFMFVREPLERLASAYRYRCLVTPMCRQRMLQSPGRSLKQGEIQKCCTNVVSFRMIGAGCLLRHWGELIANWFRKGVSFVSVSSWQLYLLFIILFNLFISFAQIFNRSNALIQ